jgi:hypothetical protein
MASEIDWNSLGGTKDGKRKTNFLKFEAGKMYTVRPVGKAYEFFKFFHRTPEGPRSVVVELADVNKAAAILSEHFGQEIKPQHRFAVNIIDREDNQIKILECGATVFKPFAIWSKGNNTFIGGRNGGDWIIQVDGDGLNRKYSCSYLRPSPLSDDEIKRFKEGADGKPERYDLEAIYKGTAIGEILTKMAGQPAASAPDPDSDVPANLPKQAAPVVAGAGADDPAMW